MLRRMIDLTGRWLDSDAAASYARMLAAGCPPGVTSAGRTIVEQTALRRAWLRGEGSFALPPGQSEHERGLALDLPEPARTWVRTHGRAYGWVKDVNPVEPWHVEYVRDLDQHKHDTTNRRNLMVIIRNGTRVRAVCGDRIVGLNVEDVARFAAAGVPVVDVTNDTWEQMRAGLTPEVG